MMYVKKSWLHDFHLWSKNKRCSFRMERGTFIFGWIHEIIYHAFLKPCSSVLTLCARNVLSGERIDHLFDVFNKVWCVLNINECFIFWLKRHAFLVQLNWTHMSIIVFNKFDVIDGLVFCCDEIRNTRKVQKVASILKERGWSTFFSTLHFIIPHWFPSFTAFSDVLCFLILWSIRMLLVIYLNVIWTGLFPFLLF